MVTMELMRVLPSGGLSSFCDSRIGFNFAGSLNDLLGLLDFPARSLEARERLNMPAEIPALTNGIESGRVFRLERDRRGPAKERTDSDET